MQKGARKKQWEYKVAMLLKHWKVTSKEPIRDLCMIVVMYAQDVEPGLLHAVGKTAALTTNKYGRLKDIYALSRIVLWDKNEKEILVKGVMNGNYLFHAFLFENGTVRVIKEDKPTFDIALKPEIISMSSGNHCKSLFIIDEKMHAYRIKDKASVRVTGLPGGINIKDISCGDRFTAFLSECGRVFGIGLNYGGMLGLPRRIEKTGIPTKIIFPNQSDTDKNGIIINTIHSSQHGWVAVDSKQRGWIVGDELIKSVRSDYKSLDPCIGIVEVWHFNDIQIIQIKCGWNHVIALDIKGRVYWFGKFNNNMSFSQVSADPISFSHRIVSIRSGYSSVACKDTTNEWYIWGWNSYNQIVGLCGCKKICKKARWGDIISNPMRCEWQGLFNTIRVIDLQLGHWKI